MATFVLRYVAMKNAFDYLGFFRNNGQLSFFGTISEHC